VRSRREVSWTLTKKLDAFAGPGKIKKREVVIRSSPDEIKSREVELGLRFGLLLLFPVAKLWTLSLGLCSA